MHTAVPVKPALIPGPSQTTGRPVAMTTRAPASAARRRAAALRLLTRMPSRSSRVPSMSETTSLGAGMIREGASTWPSSQLAKPRTTSRRSGAVGEAEDAVQVGVAEQAPGIDVGPGSPHVLEAGVPLVQLFGIEAVQLAPVRAAAVAEQYLFDGQEVPGKGLPVVTVHRDVGARSLVRRRQPDVVGGRHPDLQR